MEEIIEIINLNTGFVGLLSGIAAIILLAYELKMRRKIMTDQVELEREKFISEENKKADWQRWLERQKGALADLSNPIAEKVSSELKGNCEWATEAMQRAKLGPYSETLFGDRSGHFRKEKELLTKNFSLMLLNRCKYLCEKKGREVYILIDSGTTLFPLFKYIGYSTVKAHNNDEAWLSKLNIITNNIPGMQSLMEHGRPTPSNRYSGLAINCRLLPGAPLPIYSAVTGKETGRYLEILKKDAGIRHAKRKKNNVNSEEGPVFISIMTGNWVRINERSSRCPIPLARGEGHQEFKQQLLDFADEVYVISPLGKVFANASIKKVNSILGLKNNSKDPEKESYKEVCVDGDDKYKKMKLVSTCRRDGRILSKLSTYLIAVLQISERVNEALFIKSEIGETQHILFPFDDLSIEPCIEESEEFPHYQTRNEGFMKYFKNP